MITTITGMYPDEIFYSGFARYHKINGNLKLSDTIYELLGYNTEIFSLNQVFGLNILCNKISDIFNYTPEYLIRNHTNFPYFKPFMNKKQSEKIIIQMKKSECIKHSPIIRINSMNSLNEFKICPKCYSEEKEKYGEAYIHRTHQLFGVFICDKHEGKLVTIKYNRYSFIDLEDIGKMIKENTEIVSKDCIVLLHGITRIINSDFWYEQDLDKLKERYRQGLIEKGYQNKDGLIKQAKLINDFKKFYSAELFSLLNFDSECSFISKIVSKKNTMISPLQHILFIKFLFGGLDKFENYQYKELEKFSTGPWPCLNPCCPKYKEMTIKTCNIKKNIYKGWYTGIFQCNICGFTYIRKYNPIYDNKFKIGKIISYGYLWDNKLRDIVSCKTYSLRELARIMKCSRDTIQTQAKKLSIYIGDYSERKDKRKEKDSKGNTRADEYKMKIIDLIDKDNSLIRTDIRKLLPKEYEYLYRNQRKWFEDNLPKPVPVKEHMKKYSQNYWKTKDVEIYGKVENAVLQIIQNTSLKRVTKHAIADIVSYHEILRPYILAKMPLTKQLLNEKCESFEQFKLRKNK